LKILDETRKSKVVSKLQEIVGKNYATGQDFSCVPYSRDQGNMTRGRVPDIVVRAGSAEDMQGVIRLANEEEIPVYTKGTYTSPFGYYPIEGGIMLDCTRMDRVINIDENSLSVVIEPGITFGALDKALYDKGYEMLVAPAGSLGGTVGGHVSSGGSSAFCILISSQGECVLGLRIVLPNGELLATGTAANPTAHGQYNRYCLMNDLTGLFIGAEGTLGALYEIALKIEVIPEAAGFATYSFDSVDDAARAVYLSRRKKIPAKIIQLADGTSLDFTNPSKAPHSPAYVRWIRVNGTKAVVDDAMQQIKDIAAQTNATDLGSKPSEEYWADRFRSMARFLYSGGSRLSYHVHVPIGELGYYWHKLRELANKLMKEYQTQIIFSWHPCDRACLTTFTTFLNDADEESFQKARTVWQAMKAPLLDMGGTFYRVGYDYSADQMYRTGTYWETIKTIKKALDPKGIMNPGFGYLDR